MLEKVRSYEKMGKKPEINFNIDLNRTNDLGIKEIATANGTEKTLTISTPIKGCQEECDFCSIKHLQNPDIKIDEELAKRTVDDIEKILSDKKNQEVGAIKLFNGGNIFRKEEMNQKLWEYIPDILKKHPKIKALEVEVRIDDFVSNRDNSRDIILNLSQRLIENNQEFRVILALEYIEQTPKAAKIKEAIQYLQEARIPWLGYAMLGGKSLTEEQSIRSAADTMNFGLKNGAREMIVNSQYKDPIQKWEEKRDDINYLVPTDRHFIGLLKEIKQSQYLDPRHRVRITTEKENTINDTEGPELEDDLKKLIDDFNKAEYQKNFLISNFNF